MEPATIGRWAVVAVGVGVLLVVAGVGGSTFGVGALDDGDGDTGPQTVGSTGDGAVGAQNESGEGNATIPANQTLEVMQTVENRTNGTVVGARLSGEERGLSQSTFVYELDVLAANGTRLVAEIYADNQTMIGVRPANESDSIFGDIFESDEGVPDEARNASSLRSATEAVRIAVNETEREHTNQTVTGVELGAGDDGLVYTVTLLEPGGEPLEIAVSADNESDVGVTTDPQRGGS